MDLLLSQKQRPEVVPLKVCFKTTEQKKIKEIINEGFIYAYIIQMPYFGRQRQRQRSHISNEIW